MTDLEDLAGFLDGCLQLQALFDGYANRLLAEHMLAGLQRAERGGYVEGVGRGDDDRIEIRIGEHLVVLAVGPFSAMRDRHALAQIVGDIADGIKISIDRLCAAFKMRRLGDLPGAEDTYAKAPFLFCRHLTFPYFCQLESQHRFRRRREQLPRDRLHDDTDRPITAAE